MPQASVLTSSTVVTKAATAGRHAAPPFVCTWQTGGTGAAWVDVAGELDIATSPQLRQTLRDAELHAHLIVLDLRELIFMDSSGLHVILDAVGGTEWEGPRVIVVRGPVQVDRVFTLTGTSDQVSIFDFDPTEADRELLHLA